MEKACNWEHQTLINELTQGRQLAIQLKNQLDKTKSPESSEFLVGKLLSSYDKALSHLNLSASMGETFPVIGMLESRHFTAGSPRSEDSNRYSKDQSHRSVLKKRKILPERRKQVRVCSETGLGCPPDDSYGWRKYGQKEILGAKYPRCFNFEVEKMGKMEPFGHQDMYCFLTSSGKYPSVWKCLQLNLKSSARQTVQETATWPLAYLLDVI
ncbi:unnamed protein product, partial [Ilex paraguariensis]